MFRFVTRSFKGKIVLTVLLGVLAVGGAAGWVAVQQSSRAVKEQWLDQLSMVADRAGSAVLGFLETKRGDLRGLAALPSVVAVLQSGGDPAAGERASRDLEAFQGGHPEYVELLVMDREGYVRASSVRQNVGRHNPTDAYFTGGLKGEYLKQPYLSETTARALGRPGAVGTFVLSRPVLDSNGQVIGVIAGRFLLETLSERVQEFNSIGATGDLYLTLPDGTAISESRFVEELKQAGRVQQQTALEMKWVNPETGQLTRAVAAAARGESGVEPEAYPDFRGVPVYGAYRWLAGPGWGLVAEVDAAEVHQLAVRLRNQIVAITLAAALLAGGLALWMGARIARPVVLAAGVAGRVAAGDLREQIDAAAAPGDESGRLLKAVAEMIGRLRSLVGEVRRTAEGVATASQQLAASAGQVRQATEQVASAVSQLASGADSQAQTATRTAANMKQLGQLISSVATAAGAMGARSQEAAERAHKGRRAMGQVARQIQNIQETVAFTARSVDGLGARSQQIGKISEVITGIADQTNLLSLNAAIEAARAGEHGRGFAVVADEVRKLAEESRRAAEQIAGLIGEIRQEIDGVVQAMREGSAAVEAGVETVKESDAALVAIVEAVEQVARQVQEVAAAAQQMAATGDEVVRAVEEMSAVIEESSANTEEVSSSAQEQSASVQEIAAAARSLAEMAADLQRAVAAFKL